MNTVDALLYFSTLVFSFTLCFFLTRIGIPWLQKLRMGQTILEIGPNWHKSKEGTPTMGGVFFIAATILSFLLFGVPTLLLVCPQDLSAVYVLLLMVCHGAIGCLDDYIKFFKQRNRGLSVIQKLVLQFAVTGAFLFAMSTTGKLSTALVFPFLGVTVELGIFYYLFALLFIVLIVNSVNLTDGLDGLAGSVTSVVLVLFSTLAFLTASEYMDALLREVLFAAVLGAVLAFLCFNRYPAKVFMGDTGSLFLGAAVCGAAFWFEQPLLLVFCGIVYLWEAITVMLQVGYFKLTHGKRIFKMAPFHHHLEKSGWSETQVVALFVALTLVGCAVCLFI